MEKELKTVIENKSKGDLVIMVCTRNGQVPKAEVKQGSRLTMKHSLHWTFEDYMVQPKYDTTENRSKLSLNSDICCDYERIIVKESIDGALVLDKEARRDWSLWGWLLGLLYRVSCKTCIESKRVAPTDPWKLSINSDNYCHFKKIFKLLKKAVTQRSSKVLPM